MRVFPLLLFWMLLPLCLLANKEKDTLQQEDYKFIMDSINATFTYKTGDITLSNGAELHVPKGFRFLDGKQSKKVLEELWGNPESNETMGMLFPENLGPLDQTSWAFEISFDALGYIKDEDAHKTNFDDVLKEMKSDVIKENEIRMKGGFAAVELVGWASPPYYDAENKVLHWAKELKFDHADQNTLNYDVRILGRKGVLRLNAIGQMSQLPMIKAQIPFIVKSAGFTDGHRYADFNPQADDVAVWTIGGLVAGKVLAKAGFFVVLLKFWKLIAAAFIGIGSYFTRFFRKRKENAVKEATLRIDETLN
jgi:uncharacterized membrane-anchored protein